MLKIATIFILFCTAHTVLAMKYNILSMDGGGIKGIITVKVVEFIEEYIKNYSI
jgi:patatin-like phospholipase/acyl hydrolase